MIVWGQPGDEKPEMTYADLVREDYRITRMKAWSEMVHSHKRFGCPLVPAKDGTFAGACVLHGFDPDGPEMTYEEWMRGVDD